MQDFEDADGGKILSYNTDKTPNSNGWYNKNINISYNAVYRNIRLVNSKEREQAICIHLLHCGKAS